MTYSLVKVFASAHLPLSIRNHYLSSHGHSAVGTAQECDRPALPAAAWAHGPRTDGFSFPHQGLGQTRLITGSV